MHFSSSRQVNAGVGEVAKVFLNPSRGFANPATTLNKNNANNVSTLSFSTPMGSVKDTPAGVQCPTPLAPAGVLANSNNATNASTAGARSSPLNETGGDSPSGQSTVVTAVVDHAQTQHEQDLVLKLKVNFVLLFVLFLFLFYLRRLSGFVSLYAVAFCKFISKTPLIFSACR